MSDFCLIVLVSVLETINAVSSRFPLPETATFLHHRERTFFYPYVMQILKQKYICKDLFITHHLGNLQRFVKFLLNSQKYQTPKTERKKKKMIIMQPHSHTPLSLFLEGERERTLGTSLKCMCCGSISSSV